jgi:2'-hydroxyisoflavone reductase
MRVLVLGGTAFLSGEVARQAIEAGHDVTCAARGRSGRPPQDARFVRLDRRDTDALAPLSRTEWDAVIDVADSPALVRSAVATLGPHTQHWTYVSTGSVYADRCTPGQRADARTLEPPPEADGLGESVLHGYGGDKVACEQAVAAAVGDRAFICRPGLIVGPGDPSGRFTYWPTRVAGNEEVLAPGTPTDLVQMIDVRDLATWLLIAAETRRIGTLDGRSRSRGRGDMLNAIAQGVDAQPTFTWVDQEFLLAHQVKPYMGPRSLPLWLPLPDYGGVMARDVAASMAADLRTRPLEETARDTLLWAKQTPDAVITGLTRQEEASLLRKWHQQRGARARIVVG